MAGPYCDVCFKSVLQTTSFGEFGKIFRILFTNSAIEMAESMHKLMKACEDCLRSINNIAKFKDTLVQNVMLDKKKVPERGIKSVACCSICLVKNEDLLSFNEFETIINILCLDINFEVSEEYLKHKKCCKRCKDLLVGISDFRDFIIEKHFNDEVDSVCRNGIQKEVQSSKSQSIDHSPRSSDLDNLESVLDEDDALDDRQSKTAFKSGWVICEPCNKAFKDRHSIFIHYTTTQVHAVKKFPCHFCHKEFLRQRLLDSHINFVHEKKGGYLCPTCGKKFCTPKHLRSHMTYHRNPSDLKRNRNIEDPKVCDECGKVLKNSLSYKKHMKYLHNATKDNAYCEKCNKQYSTFRQLKIHLANSVNHGKKKFECTHCDMKFMTRPLLEGHIQFVHEKKGHQCPICQKVFPPPHALTKHMKRVHYASGFKKYECKQCSKKFVTKGRLEGHIQYVHEKKGHSCPICKKVCPPPYGLTEHMKKAHNNVSEGNENSEIKSS